MSSQPDTHEENNERFSQIPLSIWESCRGQISPITSRQKTLSTILPGYIMYHTASTAVKRALMKVWGISLASHANRIIGSLNPDSLFRTYLATGVPGTGIAMAISTLLANFTRFDFRSQDTINFIESQTKEKKAEQTKLCVERFSDLEQPTNLILRNLEHDIRTAVNRQVEQDPDLIFSGSKLLELGVYGRLILALFLSRTAETVINKSHNQHSIDSNLAKFLRNTKQATSMIFDLVMGINEHLPLLQYANSYRDESSTFNPFNTWASFAMLSSITEYIMPIKLIVNFIIYLTEIESISRRSPNEAIPKIMDFIVNFFQPSTTAHQISTELLEAIRNIHTLNQIIWYVNENYPYHTPSESFMVANPEISCSDLSHQFNETGVVLYESISINLKPGIIWLEGENGVGKTFFAKILKGNVRPSEGMANLCGIETAWIHPNCREKMFTHIPNMFSSDSDKPVIFHILLNIGISLFSQSELERIRSYTSSEEILEGNRDSTLFQNIFTLATMLGVESHLEKDSSEALSDGQKKLLTHLTVMMRAKYIENMKVIILDEPSAGLSRSNTSILKTSLQDECFHNKITVVITHNPRIFEINPVQHSQHFELVGRKFKSIPVSQP